MRFLTVTERELRAAARRKGLYRVRWWTAVCGFGLMVWLAWLLDSWRSWRGGQELFQVFSVLAYIYTLLVGATGTADCLSRERREGTLGLLFLTNLSSGEIVVGKLLSSILGTVYPLIGLIPILSLPLLGGGVSGGHLWRTALAMLNGIVCAVTMGMMASVVSRRQFPAVALGTIASLVVGLGLAGLAAVISEFHGPAIVAEIIAAFCPLTTLVSAEGNNPNDLGAYWLSLCVCLTCAGGSLLFVSRWLALTWRDRPKRTFFWQRWKREGSPRSRAHTARLARRQRRLRLNPIYWLATQGRVAGPAFMGLTLAVGVITLAVLAPMFTFSVGGSMAEAVGLMISTVIGTLALHALALGYAGMVASQRLAEDKQSGSLELILCTPMTEHTLRRGLWLAFGRRMLFPFVALAVAHTFLLWNIGLCELTDSPSNYPPDMTPGVLIWRQLLGHSFTGYGDEWGVRLMARLSLAVFGLLVGVWFTLGHLARWLGLWMKHPGFAPLASLGIVAAPPVILFSLVCWMMDVSRLNRLPEEFFVPFMVCLALAIGFQHCLLVSVWAAGRVRRDLRAIATGSYEGPRHWWLPGWRPVLRLGGVALAMPVLLALLILGYYTHQNWRSKRDWAAFQQELKRSGKTLELASALPAPAPDEQNFVRAPAFQSWLALRSNAPPSGQLLIASYEASRVPLPPNQQPRDLICWLDQRPLDLHLQLKSWLATNQAPANSNREVCAAFACQRLVPLGEPLRDLAEAASNRPFFQVSTNQNAATVLLGDTRELWSLSHAHFLFALRATARGVTGDNDGALEDVLTSLRLVKLAAQSPDASGVPRANTLLLRSLQPVWESIVAHRWNDQQLARLEAALAPFDLIADFTNAVHRVALAQIEDWRLVYQKQPRIGRSIRNNRNPDQWDWMPNGWWLNYCMRFYRGAAALAAEAKPETGFIPMNSYGRYLRDLPLEGPTQALMQQTWWGATPSALAATALSQARAACALERWRLAQGAYPTNLSELLPRFLQRIPADSGPGRPLTYVRDDPGHYALIGLGPNGTMDRGKPASDDWLWTFPRAATNTPKAKPGPRR